MIRQSIQRKIVSIAVGLVVLMLVTAALSMLMAARVGHLLDEMTNSYIPAYGNLARMNIRSLERALALRRMVIAKMQNPPDDAGYVSQQQAYKSAGIAVEREAAEARKSINAIIADTSTPSDNIALARLDSRIDAAINDLRRYLNGEIDRLLPQLEARDFEQADRSLARIDRLRDEFNQKIDAIRADMLTQVFAGASTVIRDQQRAIIVSAIATVLAAVLGMVFATMVGSGIARPVLRLLEGTRALEAGNFGGSIDVKTRDEVGQLTEAFNRMVEKLRHNEKVRETFGRYIDPKVVEGLIEQPALAASEGQRRVMTVMFCDMRGFTSLSEGVTPQGLVKVMNRYLSIMSEPVRNHRGVIDKYMGDAIMAYWGPPFVDETDQGGFACLAAVEMMSQVPAMRRDLPELLGVRAIPIECDIRIGVATGDALVGSIGSEFMMSYTVMGDVVNLASRLESANKEYGSRCLVSETTILSAGAEVEAREIDRLVVFGQKQPQVVYEIMARKSQLSPEQLLLRRKYSEGLAAYRAQRWDEACDAFNSALEAVPDDGPSKTLARRVERFKINPPADNWDGSWILEHK